MNNRDWNVHHCSFIHADRYKKSQKVPYEVELAEGNDLPKIYQSFPLSQVEHAQ